MEPIPLSSVVLSRPTASGGGYVSMWRGSVTVSPGCPLFVDTVSWAHTVDLMLGLTYN